MGRTCDKCGSRMGPFIPRVRLEDGSQVCKGCANRHDTPAPKTAGKNPMLCPEGHEFYAEGYSATCPKCGKPASLDVEEINGLGLFLQQRKEAGIPDHYRVLVLDRGEEVPIVVWSGHDPSACMTKAMEEHADPDSVHVYIDRLIGAMGQYRIIWQDGQITENFQRSEASGTTYATCPECSRDVPVRGGFFAQHQKGKQGRCPGSGKPAPKQTEAARKVAHDSGDGETIFHCPFCGAGQVVARSDGTAECGFCQTAFTVQVQPNMAAVPQTIDGVPHVHPDMPGSDPGTVPDETAPEEQAQETALTPQEQQDQGGIFASRRMAGTFDLDGYAPEVGDHVYRGDSPVATITRIYGRYEDGWSVGTSPDLQLIPGDGVVVYLAGIHSNSRIWKAISGKSASRRYFLTESSVALPEDAYIRHLAIKHADDRQAVIAAVRAERESR